MSFGWRPPPIGYSKAVIFWSACARARCEFGPESANLRRFGVNGDNRSPRESPNCSAFRRVHVRRPGGSDPIRNPISDRAETGRLSCRNYARPLFCTIRGAGLPEGGAHGSVSRGWTALRRKPLLCGWTGKVASTGLDRRYGWRSTAEGRASCAINRRKCVSADSV